MVTIKRFHFLLLIFILFIPDLHAAPYIPIGEIEAQIANSVQIDADGPWRGDQLPQFNRELDERVYLDEYMQILEWQVGMQVDDPGPAFGGQREGELDWNIIQTDNTQEVLRDWAWYARYTGDLERYRENIDASFEYTMNYPAYNEEGGGNPNYYRVHNCGWALVAVMEHIRAYGDSTYLWYGDSCAVYLDSYRLTFNNTFSLNALAAGYGAGALYEYGVWRENQEWIEAAQEIAEDVQAWIESNPNHLSNETWAMSGGTAMWGVVTALFSDDHEAGQEWLPDYVDDLAIYTPEGNWNNSATVWNGHAWAAIYEVLGDQESYDNMLWVTDFLLAQDYEDDDGGIPASEDNYENDQSWTSAYLVWYLLEKLIPPHPPTRDAAILSIVSPTPGEPLLLGEEIPLTIQVGNIGNRSVLGALLTVNIGDFTSELILDIQAGYELEVDFEENWTPEELGETPITFDIEHELDYRRANNVLSDTYEVVENNFAGVRFVPDNRGGRVNEQDDTKLRSEPNALLPEQFDAYAFPNPFNPNTTLTITLPEHREVILNVTDILGRSIYSATYSLDAGSHQLQLGYDLFENRLANGLYFAHIVTERKQKTIKLLLLK